MHNFLAGRFGMVGMERVRLLVGLEQGKNGERMKMESRGKEG